jgi:hypothetical protein
MSLVWERAPYTAGSLIVLLALADWANDEGVAWPSMERLAQKARIDRRSAQRIVRQLERDGVLEIEAGGGRAKQHKYVLKMETAAKCRPLYASENGDISDIKTATLDPERATSDPQRATFHTETATPTSPDPLVEPSEDPSDKPSIEPSEPMPPFLSKEFLESLKDYQQYRKEIRKPLRAIGLKKLYAQLGNLGEQRAIAAMDYSISRGWIGVFEEKNGNSNGNGATQPGTYQTAPERRDAAIHRRLRTVTGLQGRSNGSVD